MKEFRISVIVQTRNVRQVKLLTEVQAWCSPGLFGRVLTILSVGASAFWQCVAPHCGFQSCFDCRSEAHHGYTCAQYEALKKDGSEDNTASEIWKAKYTKKCFCGRPVEKKEGCDHITCPPPPIGCGKDWCWECRVDWSLPHERTCRHRGTGYGYRWENL
jgi:hypothetical protein